MERRFEPNAGAQPKPAVGLVLRPFVEADQPAILEIFDANVPAFFAREERGWLEDADSDDGARLFRSDGAHRYDLIPPGQEVVIGRFRRG